MEFFVRERQTMVTWLAEHHLRELDQEILHVESAFRYAYGIDPFEPVSPDTVSCATSLAISISRI